jgi:dCMP deaminase
VKASKKMFSATGVKLRQLIPKEKDIHLSMDIENI